MKKYIGFIILLVVVVGLILTTILLKNNPEDYLNEITYEEFLQKIENKENFVLFVKQDGCSHCRDFEPTFVNVLDKYDLKANMINLTNLGKESKENLKKFEDSEKITGTPTVIFYENGGQLMSRIEGNKDTDEIIRKLEIAKLVKDE